MNSTVHTRRLFRPVLLAIALVTTALGVQAAPTSVDLPIERPNVAQPLTALAVTCATNPLFTGRITETASTTTAANRIVDNVVFGYISDVDQAWSCTASIRYSALAWNTTTNLGTFNWGNLINSTSVACNWLVGSTDYLKANSTSDCADSDAEYAMAVTLSPQGIYQADNSHDGVGDFSFAHSDCDTYHGAEIAHTSVSFSSGATSNRPASSNCDPVTIDGTGTSQTIINDRTGPDGSISVNGGSAYATSTAATLTLSATDNVAGVKQMRFSNDGTNWSAWETYGTSKAWTLPTGQGTKTVRAQFRDHNNNESAIFSDAIYYDTADPTGSITINDDSVPDGATYTITPNVTLGLTYQDTGSGPYQMQFRNETGAWSPWEPVAATKAWTLSAGNGSKTVGYQVKDNAGRISSTTAYSDTIVLDTSLPTAPSIPDLDAESDTGASDVDNITTDSLPVFIGTAEPGSRVELFEGTEPLGTGQAALVDGRWSIASSELGPGDHSVTAEAVDVAGNTSARSAALTLTIVESDLQLAWPLQGSTLFATETLEVAFPATGSTGVDYLLDGDIVGSATTEPWTFEFDTTNETDSTHTLQAQAQTPGGVVSSATVTVTIDNSLASTERLQVDRDNGRIALDDYAANGVFAIEAPIALPERYQSPVAATSDANVGTYLADWDTLSEATQDAIVAFYSQPLRGTDYASALFPTSVNPGEPIQGDQCKDIETRQSGSVPGPIIGTAEECVHETAHFTITYTINGTGIYADESVDVTAGIPTIINEYHQALEEAYSIYSSDLGYDVGWQGKVPVRVHVPPGGGTGYVGDPAAIFAGNAQQIHLAPHSAPYVTAHHEVFHVIQGRYVSIVDRDFPGLVVAFFRDNLRWLSESTAEWAAGYATRAGAQGDEDRYADSLPRFLRHPDIELRRTEGTGGREYGAWILHEYLVEKVALGDPSIVRKMWERVLETPGDPMDVVTDVLAQAPYNTGLGDELPDFWKAAYLLDFDDSSGTFASDVESVWRSKLQDDGDAATHGDAWAPARPQRVAIGLSNGGSHEDEVSVDRGGAIYREFRPSESGIAGDFTFHVDDIARPDLDLRVLTVGYEPGDPAPPPAAARSAVCSETPLPYDGTGIGEITVQLRAPCDYALLVVSHTEPLGEMDSVHWNVTFNRKTVVATNSDWKTLELWWAGDTATPRPEPSGWLASDFDDSAWPNVVIRSDPYHSWVDVKAADMISSTGSVTPFHLTGEIWIARLEFDIEGNIPENAILRWNVDNKASIWINGHQVASNAGTWSSISGTTVPAAYLQTGRNTIAVRITQDNNTNTWSINPTMFQAELAIPSDLP